MYAWIVVVARGLRSLLEKCLDRFCGLNNLISMAFMNHLRHSGATHVDEFLKVIIQVGKIVFASLVVGDEFLLPFQQLLTLLLQSFALCAFVLDTGEHKGILVVGRMIGELFEKFFDGD